jgi:hypothetical protein
MLSCAFVLTDGHAEAGRAPVEIQPEVYDKPLRNPLKGFRADWEKPHPYVTLDRVYVPWNKIERNKDDGIEQIRKVSRELWGGVEDQNIKVIPRVYLHWPPDRNYWPADMKTGDYTSEQFKRRVTRLVHKLGQAWDDDPRVAYVQMGIIGKWGEHHSPHPSPEVEQLLGRAFEQTFDKKHVTVRRPWEFFTDFSFGAYWDSFAHIQQQEKHGGSIAKLGDRWKHKPIAGEVAYNWGDYKQQPGDSPNDTLRDPNHREHLLDTIRWLHANNLGWVANYDPSKPAVARGADEVQKAFGYRFLLKWVRYSSQVEPGGDLGVRFAVKNVGSSPLYYDWPVAVSLLHPETHELVWQDTFERVNTRHWMPGDEWDKEADRYRQPAQTYHESGKFMLPDDLKNGRYILAMAVLDPAGMVPSLRFATKNYFRGGWHPIGRIGVGSALERPELDQSIFDSLNDRSLHYEVKVPTAQ